MKIIKLEGLIAAPFTPFFEDGEVNYKKIREQANSLIADGVTGAYICGTTGEGISCTVQERIQIMETWKQVSHNKLKLIAHTGALALGDVKVLSQKASELGYNAFSVIPTTFFKPESEEMLVDYCAEVANYAPNLPFYYYHTMNSGVNLSMSKFLSLANNIINNLAGIKFNHHNLYEYQKCIQYENGKYDIVFGVDEFFAGALALGAKGFIGSTYNYSAELYLDILSAFKANNQETILNRMNKVCKIVDLLIENGGISAGKAMMLVKGIDCGITRKPLKALPIEMRKLIAQKVSAILIDN